jgi:hypothetical protein
MTSETLEETPTEAMRRVLTEADSDGEKYLINPPAEFLFALATVGKDVEELPTINIVGKTEALRQLRQDFLMGSRLSTLMADDHVRLREQDLGDETPMLVGEGELYALALIEDIAAAIRTDDPEFVERVRNSCELLWDNAAEYVVRTPPLEELLVSMETTLGPDFRDGFETSLDVAAGLRDRTEFHEVRAALVVAAYNEILHYDVSKWGEDSGLASTASFSRHKSALEDNGVLDTEKEPVQMGRPRQRLMLTEKYREMAAENGVNKVLARTAMM